MIGGIKELLKPLAAWFETNPSGHPDALNFQIFEPGRGASLVDYWSGKPGLDAFLAPFGWTRNGSLYAFWFVEEAPLAQQPIVLLDSDADYSVVVAKSYLEFLALLSAGLEDFDDPESALPDSPELLAFRDWALTQGIANIPDFVGVNAITREAFEESPDLLEWLEEKLA
ncbi:MAG: hypothetical protein NTX57_07425 [Armatimonadetes bacterium]|nr:hypothetical protein [Armatimonadota bacterium]